MIVTLAGGVGAARFLKGLCLVRNPRELVAVINTADDIVLHGLHQLAVNCIKIPGWFF